MLTRSTTHFRFFAKSFWILAILLTMALIFSSCEESSGNGGTTETDTDGNGGGTGGTVTATITSPSEVAGTASFPIGLPVDFSASVTSTGGGTLSYLWEFDSSELGAAPGNSTEQNPTGVIFVQSGSYVVVLSVTDLSTGASDTDTLTVTVNDPFTEYTANEMFQDDTLISQLSDGGIVQLTREITGGALHISLSGTTGGELYDELTTIENAYGATVTAIVLDVSGSIDGGANIHFHEVYSDGTGVIEAGLYVEPLNEEVGYYIDRCLDEECFSFNDLGSAVIGSVLINEIRTLGIHWDGTTTFTFEVDGTPTVVDVGSSAPFVSELDPSIAIEGYLDFCTADCSVEVLFDNFEADLTNDGTYIAEAFDAFDDADSQIDLTFWEAGEFLRVIDQGVLNVGRREIVNVDIEPFPNEFINISTGSTVFAIETAATVVSYSTTGGGQTQVGLIGGYNDSLGEDVLFGLQYRGIDNALDVSFFSGKCVAGVYSFCDTFDSDPNLPADTVIIPAATTGQTYTLQMAFDGTYLTFNVDGVNPISFEPGFTHSGTGVNAFTGLHWGFEALYPSHVLTDTTIEMFGSYDNLMVK